MSYGYAIKKRQKNLEDIDASIKTIRCAHHTTLLSDSCALLVMQSR